MFIIQLIRTLIGLYALLLLVHFALPYVSAAQQPWMAKLAKICEPGVQIGNRVAAKLFPEKRFKIDVGALAAAALCWVARLILNLFA